MTTEKPRLLLDTCVLLFSARDAPIAKPASDAIDEATPEGRLYVSPVSAWEFGQLVRCGRLKATLPAFEFFDQLVTRAVATICELTPEVMAKSSFLPHLDHRDPADCLLIATARAFDFTLVTRDRTILAYGAAGHVKVLAC
jgi:PIN domain nuclease of toxin-antitoxin system